MKNFIANLKELRAEKINCLKKKMLLVTKNEQKSNKKQKFCHIYEDKLTEKSIKDKNHCKVHDHCH